MAVVKSPYTPQERDKLNQLHEKLKNTDGISKRQITEWKKQMLAIERAAHKRETEPSDGGSSPKPTLEDFGGDEDEYREALELWRIAQDERLAHSVLDNSGATFTARENANRTLRRCQRRRQEIEPFDDDDDSEAMDDDDEDVRVRRYAFPNWIDDANPVSELDDIPWCQRFPYRESQKRDYLTSDEARQQHKNLGAFLDQCQRIGKMSPEERKAFWDKMEFEHLARVEQRRLEDSTAHAKFNPRSIKTPLELATWKRQSEHFARLRGEIVDTPQPETIESPKQVEGPNRTVAYQLTDGFMFWADGTAAELPLPLGTPIYRAPNPPSYRTDENEKRIPSGWRYDFLNFMWVRTQ
jgi:hypothetical protein